MTKEERENFKKGKRDPDSDSEYSYRSYVSDGGTRHVARRRRREDGTYSAEHSYHSSQVTTQNKEIKQFCNFMYRSLHTLQNTFLKKNKFQDQENASLPVKEEQRLAQTFL